MYKSRKKILLIGGISVVVLAGFAVGAWAIIDASYNIPSDDAQQSKYAGATSYLSGNNGQLEIDKMSVSDWINYNMPQTLIKTTQSDGTVYWDYYNVAYSATYTTAAAFATQYQEQNLIARLIVTESSSAFNYEVWTNPYANVSGSNGGVRVASSNTTIGDSISTTVSADYWTDSISYNFAANTPTTDEAGTTTTTTYSSATVGEWTLDYTYAATTTTSSDGTSSTTLNTQTYEVTSNTGVVNYTQTYVQTSSTNYTISYVGTNGSIRATYNANTSIADATLYQITYQNLANNNTINNLSTYQNLWKGTNDSSWSISLPMSINLFFFLRS